MLVRRITESIFSILLAILLVTGSETFVAPDIARTLLGTKATQSEVDSFRHQLGLDRPFWQRARAHVSKALEGDFGISYAFRRPVAPILFQASLSTLALVLPALVAGLTLGIGLGVWAARDPSPARRWSLRLLSSVCLLPSLIISTWIVYVLGYKLDWVNPSYIAAVCVVALVPMAVITQTTYQELAPAFESDFVRAQRSFGLSESAVVLYLLRPAAIAVTSSFTNLVLYLLVSTAFVEITFNRSGLGTLLMNACDRVDYPVLMAIVLLVAIAFGLMNLVSGLVVYVADPRTR